MCHPSCSAAAGGAATPAQDTCACVPALFQGAKVRSKQGEGHWVSNPALPELEVEGRFLFPQTNEQICFHLFKKIILGMHHEATVGCEVGMVTIPPESAFSSLF